MKDSKRTKVNRTFITPTFLAAPRWEEFVSGSLSQINEV